MRNPHLDRAIPSRPASSQVAATICGLGPWIDPGGVGSWIDPHREHRGGQSGVPSGGPWIDQVGGPRVGLWIDPNGGPAVGPWIDPHGGPTPAPAGIDFEGAARSGRRTPGLP